MNKRKTFKRSTAKSSSKSVSKSPAKTGSKSASKAASLKQPRAIQQLGQLDQAHPNPIKITPPLRWPRLFAPSTPPNFTYRGGPLLTNIAINAVYWGDTWNTSPILAPLKQQMDKFLSYLVTSPLQAQMSEYSTSGYSIGNGSLNTSTIITANTPHILTFDFLIRNMLQNQISSGQLPGPTANSLYAVFLPPNVKVIMGFTISCLFFCGYHNAINNNIFYAVLPYPDCSSCRGGLAPFDALTSITSHEIYEAVTDAVPGTGWYDNSHGEIADVCAWQTKELNGYTVQKEWSNTNNSCI